MRLLDWFWDALRGLFDRILAMDWIARPGVRRFVKIVLGLLLAVLLVWLLVWAWGAIEHRTRQLLLVLLLVGAVVVWYWRGAQWLERRKLLGGGAGDLSPGNPTDEVEPRRLMQEALLEAKRAISGSPEIGVKADPLYRIPWFMLLGDSATAAEPLLRSAAAFSPFPPPPRAGGEGQYWHWWFLRGMVAIEADPRFICDASDRVHRGIWYQALQLIKNARSGMPLNGVVALVAADRLAGDQDALRAYALNLRRVIDECMVHLDVVLPLYIVVTRCDRMPGLAETLSAVPPEALRQAVGHRFDWAAAERTGGWHEFAPFFARTRERFHAIRLAALRRAGDAKTRKGVWDFVAAFERLEPGLAVVTQVLLEDNALQRAARWRGIYFTAAEHDGAFVEDLFVRFLPADQPLAQRTRRPGLRRWLGAGVGVLLVAALSGMVARQVWVAIEDNRRLEAAVKTACHALAETGEQLAALAECSRDIAQVDDLRRSAGITWGIDAYTAGLAEKKKVLLTVFQRRLAAYEERVGADISARHVTFEHIAATAQRIAFVRRCDDDIEDCHRLAREPNLLFDPAASFFGAVQAGAAPDASSAAEVADQLLELYFAYLRWGADVSVRHEFFSQEAERSSSLFARIASAHPATPEDAVAWAHARHQALSLRALWKLDGGVREAAAAESPQIEPAYTIAIWDDVIAPTLAELPGGPAAAQEFARRYFEGYFAAWRDFLAHFGDGFKGVDKTNAAALLERSARGDSPYAALRESLQRNVLALPLRLGYGTRTKLAMGEMAAAWLDSPWAAGRWVKGCWRELRGSQFVKPPPWVVATLFKLRTDWRGADVRLKPWYAALDADRTGDEAFRRASEIHASGGEKPADFAELWRLASAPPKSMESELAPEDVPAFGAIAGEVRLLVLLMDYRAAALHLDPLWASQAVPRIAEDLRADPKFAVARGTREFCEKYMASLAKCANGSLADFQGVHAPMSTWFQNGLARRGPDPAPQTDPNRPIRVGKLELEQRSTFGVQKEGEQGTALDIACGANRYAVSSKGESRGERSIDVIAVPETCTAAHIKVALPEYERDPADPPGPLSLTKTYSTEVIKAIADDFKTGAKSFNVDEFRSSYAPDEWDVRKRVLTRLGITQVRMFVRFQLTQDMQDRLHPPTVTESIPPSIVE